MQSSTREPERAASRPAGARGPAPPAGAAHDRAALHRGEPDPARRAAGLPRDEDPRPAAPRRAPARRSARSAVLVAVPLSRRRWAAGAALGRLQPERAHDPARSHPRHRRLGAVSAPPARPRQGRGGGRGRRRLEGGAVPRSRLARPGGLVAGGAARNRRRRRDRSSGPSSRRTGILALGGVTSLRYLLAPLAIVGVAFNLLDDLPGGLVERAEDAASGLLPTHPLGIAAVRGGRDPLHSLRRCGGLAARRLELHAHRRRRAAHSLARPAHAARGHDRPRAAPRRRRARHTVAAAARPRLGHSRRRRACAAAPAARRSRPSSASRRPTGCSASSTRPHPTSAAPLLEHPRAARSRRLQRAVALPALAILVAAALRAPWAVAGAVVLVVPAVVLGLDRYRQLGHGFDGRRLVLRGGSLLRRWSELDAAGVVAYELRSSPGQRRAGLCTLVVHLGQGAGSRRALDAGGEQAADLLAGSAPKAARTAIAAPDRSGRAGELLHRGGVAAADRGAVVAGAEGEERLPRLDVSADPPHAASAGAWSARPYENESTHGCGPRELIAFRFSLACSSDWPPERKTIPGTAAGTVSRKHLSVQSATSSALAWVAQPLPEMTMFGFSRIPSQVDALVVELVEDLVQRPLGRPVARLDVVVGVHQHLGLDDRHDPLLLAERRVASERVRVRLDAVGRRDAARRS